MTNAEDVYTRTGKLVEKYDVVTVGQKGGGGEYPTQDGFGWTNGVLRKLLVLYPDFVSGAPAKGCPAP
jgi:alpha,alpha-trehalase